MERTTSSKQNSYATNGRDLYKEVTNKIIALIEQGVAPWRRTWSIYGLARNYVTGHIYTGINCILMNNTGHSIPYFLTFNQVKELGGQIKKGSTAEIVIYFNVYYKDSNDMTISNEDAMSRRIAGEEIQVLKFIKYYNVFNVNDIEGIEFKFKKIKFKQKEKIPKCESIIENMKNKPQIVHGGDEACYKPSLDLINIPELERFESPENYYATLFHELVHSTGHSSRLNRIEVMGEINYSSESYSKEEILAEMGASFLCSLVQINFDEVVKNNASYLSGWLKVLNQDTKFIFKASTEAQKCIDYVLNKAYY